MQYTIVILRAMFTCELKKRSLSHETVRNSTKRELKRKSMRMRYPRNCLGIGEAADEYQR